MLAPHPQLSTHRCVTRLETLHAHLHCKMHTKPTDGCSRQSHPLSSQVEAGDVYSDGQLSRAEVEALHAAVRV